MLEYIEKVYNDIQIPLSSPNKKNKMQKQNHNINNSISIWLENTHTHPYVQFLHQERTWNFLHTLLERADHQYLNGQHLACEVRTAMCEVLTKSGLSFMYKMIQEIISMARIDSGFPIPHGPYSN